MNILRKEDVIKAISNYRSDDNFRLWIETVNPGKKLEDISPEMFIGGYCEDFAVYWSVRYGVDMLFINEEHDVVKVCGLYFDAVNSSGVENISDLEYVKSSDTLKSLPESRLRELTKVDREWMNYPILEDNAAIITREV